MKDPKPVKDMTPPEYYILSPRERKVLIWLDAGKTMVDVAEELGVTRERIRQIRDKARKKIERHIERQVALYIQLPPARKYAVPMIAEGRILSPRERRIYDLGYLDGASSDDWSDRIEGDPALREAGL